MGTGGTCKLFRCDKRLGNTVCSKGHRCLCEIDQCANADHTCGYMDCPRATGKDCLGDGSCPEGSSCLGELGLWKCVCNADRCASGLNTNNSQYTMCQKTDEIGISFEAERLANHLSVHSSWWRLLAQCCTVLAMLSIVVWKIVVKVRFNRCVSRPPDGDYMYFIGTDT